MAKIIVNTTEVSVLNLNGEDYICLTDMMKAKDGEFFVTDWLRNRNTLEYIGIWEKIYNPNFNYGEFAIIRNQAGLNRFKISVNDFGKDYINLPKLPSINQTYHNYAIFHLPILISGRFYLFFLKYEYFCKKFTGGIFNYRQDESTNINKREGKKKGCFISRFPYFTAYHGRIWISGTDHLESAYHITTVAEEG